MKKKVVSCHYGTEFYFFFFAFVAGFLAFFAAMDVHLRPDMDGMGE